MHNPKILYALRVLFIFSISVADLFGAEVRYYRSGLLADATFDSPQSQARNDEEGAMRQFFQNHFAKMNSGSQWRLAGRIQDSTHAHRRYQLYYKGRRVDGAELNTHYNLQGWLQYASNGAEEQIDLNFGNETSAHLEARLREVKAAWGKKIGGYVGKVLSEPIVWIDPKTNEAKAAFEMKAMHEKPFIIRDWIVEEDTGKLLEDRNPVRQASVSVKAYKVSPFNGAVPESVSVTVDAATKLSNSEMRVRREENPNAATLVDVIPQDFTGGSFTIDPSTYTPTCTGDGNACPNQAFDAVNVYFHLSRYRALVDSYLTSLGATVSFTYDPLNVIVNPLSIDFNGDGDATNETNNAMYVGQDCRADGSMPRCLVFLRPGIQSGPSVCSDNSVQFFDLSREALVVAHEYQHYVTDMITHIQFATNSGGTSVGDALHEGYSDYLAASYVSDLAGRDVTLVAEYALQQCTAVQRELGTVRVYQNSESETDPHTSGQSWASGLWQLRKEFGMSVVDPIVLKSLFFLSTRPGFVEAIESLVKADQAINQGAHVSRIRSLFYDTVKFTGGQNNIFRDTASGYADVGFRGCAVPPTTRGVPFGIVSLISLIMIFGIWLIGTLGMGFIFKRGVRS